LLAGRPFPTITQQGTQNEFQIENFTRFLQIDNKFGTVDREKEYFVFKYIGRGLY
jgi:hypothetical protein